MQYFISNRKSKNGWQIPLIGLAMLLVSFLSPRGISAFLFPFQYAFKTFAFSLPETTSVFQAIPHYQAKVLLLALGIPLYAVFSFWYARNNPTKHNVFFAIIFVLSAFAGIFTVKCLALTGFVSFLIIALNISRSVEGVGSFEQNRKFYLGIASPFLMVYLLLPFFILDKNYLPTKKPLGIGVKESPFNVHDFVRRHNLKGSILSVLGENEYSISEFDPRHEPNDLFRYDYFPSTFYAHHFDYIFVVEKNWEWIRDKHTVEIIYADLKNQSLSNLYFLGRRLESKEWVIAEHVPEGYTVLIRKTMDNVDFILGLDPVENIQTFE